MMGMVFAKITTAYRNLLPGKRKRANAYASKVLEITFTDTFTTKIQSELNNISMYLNGSPPERGTAWNSVNTSL